MKLNIYTQICGFVVTLVIFVFYLLQKKLNIKKEKNFLRCIIASFFVFIFDITCTIMNTKVPTGIGTSLMNRIYLCSTLMTIAFIFLYICCESFSRVGYKITFYITILTLIILGSLILSPSVTELIITNEANGNIVYTTGSATLTTYITAFIVILSILVLTFFYEKDLGISVANAIRIWMFIWSGFALLQFFFKQYLIVSFGLSVGILIMYISIESLDVIQDRNTGLFNWNGYIQYVKERKKDDLACPIVYLKALDSINIFDEKTLSKSLKKFNDCLKLRKDILVFGVQNEYIIVLKSLDLEELLEFLSQEQEEHSIIANYYYPLFLKDSTKLASQNDLLSLIELASANINKSELPCLSIDTKVLQEYGKSVEVENLIEQAIKNDLIEVYLQPILDIKSKKFTSAEALVRIKDGFDRIIPPSVFIPVAEKNGMIHKLDEIVFDKVCSFIASNNMEELGLEYIEVNLSVAQLCDEGLSQKYTSIMRKYKINPDYINLEVTESAELERKKALKRNMNKLLAYGVSFSLDDYGTGYSNLNYVVEMPIKIVKLDKQMIDAYFVDEKAKKVLEYSARMFKSLNLEIVAEGVETIEQLEELKKLKVDHIQGYLYSKPIPMNEFIEFIKTNNGE